MYRCVYGCMDRMDWCTDEGTHWLVDQRADEWSAARIGPRAGAESLPVHTRAKAWVSYSWVCVGGRVSVGVRVTAGAKWLPYDNLLRLGSGSGSASGLGL